MDRQLKSYENDEDTVTGGILGSSNDCYFDGIRIGEIPYLSAHNLKRIPTVE